MKITIVMGISGSGKSTYIKNHLKDRVVIDLWDFQKNYTFFTQSNIIESYEKCMKKLQEELKNGNDVVLEHTLLRGIRRKPYINAIREITNDPIECIVINPNLDILRDRKKERKIYYNDEEIQAELEVLEIPTIEEGFDNITIINE